MVIPEVTFAVNTVGNTQALCLCLGSVLNGISLPGKIVIRSEGQFPSFSSFYLEQLAEVARIKGVEFQISVFSSQGVRKARQWQLESCSTELLWTGDDDVIFDYTALYQILLALEAVRKKSWGFIVGNKRDVNNRRGYGDFSQRPVKMVCNGCSTNLFYDKEACKDRFPECYSLDTGFALLNVGELRKKKVSFDYFAKSYNSGGEDTFFGIQSIKKGLGGFFAPCAQAFHLEKEKQNFNEFSARAEAIVRSAECAGLADGVTEFETFKWLT